MKNILILSFLYENNICIKQFELLREHYNKMINNFYLPMKYYGVRVTTVGETRVDEENQVIWLHTDNIEEYDSKLVLKVLDCLRYVKDTIDFDLILKTNTSTLINLINTNKVLQIMQSNDVITASLYQNSIMNNFSFNLCRGNYVTILKSDIDDILKYGVNNFIDMFGEHISKFGIDPLMDDEAYISILYAKLNKFCFTYGCIHIVDGIEDMYAHTPISNISEIKTHVCVVLKDYNRGYKDIEYKYLSRNASMEISIMRIFINYIEDTYLAEMDTINTITRYICN